MFVVKVLGAGSIGNHLSHAARCLGWLVDLVDVDSVALERTRTQIYPSRYGSWDEAIGLYSFQNAPKRQYDLICIGTPPDSHVALARAAIIERPRAILIEKPLCGPDLKDVLALQEEAAAAGVACFIGYDHVVGQASRLAIELLKSENIGPVVTLDVEFRKRWGGIFAAMWVNSCENNWTLRHFRQLPISA